MNEILLHYHKVHPATWAYLSSLLMLALFFKFSRFWSVRNLDLVLVILLAPGLLLVNYGRETQADAELITRHSRSDLERLDQAEAREGAAADAPAPTDDGSSADQPDRSEVTVADAARPAAVDSTANTVQERPISKDNERAILDDMLAGARKEREKGQRQERYGFYWLLATCGLLLTRLLVDPTMVRRPLLEPNLSTGGMVFMGCSLFVFLMANVMTSDPTEDDLRGAKEAQRMLARNAHQTTPPALERHGPGYALLAMLPSIPTVTLIKPPTTSESQHDAYAIVAKVMALVCHLAVVLGTIVIGYRHFDNVRMGIGAALLYLLLPYTSIMTGRVDHVLPAALLVCAVLSYRRPLLAGIFIGLATGVVYYPLFLLPLWFSFYRQRGVWRFATGVFATLAIMTLSLALVSDSLVSFWELVQQMFGLFLPVQSGMEGVWGVAWDPVYRLPVLAAFVVLSCALAIWPARKNLGTLLSCSAALMIATQFWHGFGGGLYMGWFLPLMLLTMFRPNLEDRVALSVLGESWFVRRRPRLAAVGEAA